MSAMTHQDWERLREREAALTRRVSMEPEDARLLLRMLDGSIPANAAEVVYRKWLRGELEKLAEPIGENDAE